MNRFLSFFEGLKFSGGGGKMTHKWENLVEFGEISKNSGISHKKSSMAQITNIQTHSFLYEM